MTPCSFVVEYQRFRAPRCLNLQSFHPEDGVIMNVRNYGALLQHYTASQPRRPRLEI